jgi:hypothetical protein
MATTNCRWQPLTTATLPSYFITTTGLAHDRLIDRDTALNKGIVSIADLTLAAQNVVDQFVKEGEEADDGMANITQGKTWVGEYQGDVFIFFETVEAGVFGYKRACGVAAQLPFVIGGAALLGVGGFAYGYSRKKGGGRGVPAYGLMGAAVGILAGAGLGYLAGKAFTSPTTKGISTYAGMGLIDARRSMGALARARKFHRCPAGWFWSDWAGRCVRPV